MAMANKLKTPKSAIRESNSAVISSTSWNHEQGKTLDEKPLCHDSLIPTIFHEEWWLDAATTGNFEVAEVMIGGRTVGRLPFSLTKRFGLKLIRMPELTYFLGPAIDEGEGTPNTRYLKRLDITRELLRSLPHASWQYVKCHAGTPDVIAFQEVGFRTCVQFTYEVAPDAVDALWNQLRHKTRTNIRRGQDQLVVTEWNDPIGFVRLFERNLALKGMQNELDRTVCQNLIGACLERRRGRILAVRDKQNNVVAANFCAWDATSSYYILSTRSDNSGSSAIGLLLWEAIKESSRRGLIFDFAGLGSKGSVLLYSGFGASVSARYIAVRARPLARMLSEVRLLFAPDNCFY